MKTKSSHAPPGFTLVELAVVIILVALLSLVVLVGLSRAGAKSQEMTCVNHLKEIGVLYRMWADGQGGGATSQARAANRAWEKALAEGNAGPFCWNYYGRMANESGHGDPRLLVCPSDERQPAADFASVTNNSHLSYFIGPGAGDSHPQSLLGGDRNVTLEAVPDAAYGFSPTTGQGNDVVINGSYLCWSLKMHSRGKSPGAGNILLGDGSVQQITSAAFLITNAQRLIFP